MPDNPGAWLMAAAKRRAIDGIRRDRMRERKHAEIARELDDERDTSVEELEAAMDDDLGDELLGLIFTACHPVISPEARAALTLRLIGGLTTEEIARAFLSNEPTIAQRIVRAKKAHRRGRARLRGAARGRAGGAARLGARGDLPDLQRRLCGDRGRRPGPARALRRSAAARADPRRADAGRARSARAARADGAAGLAPRGAAGPDGAFVPLTEQNRARWDQLLIRRGLDALARAEALGGADGPYALQAALAACHARAQRAEDTDWRADRRALRPAGPRRCLRRWSSSTARWRTAWRSGRRRG